MTRATLICPAAEGLDIELPMLSALVPAGFPSPAEDYLKEVVNLQRMLVPNPAATFMMRVEGNSMVGAHINNGDLIIIDRSLEATDGRIVVATIDGDYVVKRLERKGGRCWLASENRGYAPIEVTEDSDCTIWGVVRHVIHSL